MLFSTILPVLLSAGAALAQGSTTLPGGIVITTTSGILAGDDVLPTGVTYLSPSTTILFPQSSTTIPTKSGSNRTTTSGTSSTTSDVTLLVGGSATARNGTTSATSTSTAARPTNTQACNGHTEFCNRSYSNITMIAAHNFPFVKKGNAASNQDYGVTDQLNDGVRMLQAQTHYENNTMFFCHTSCSLLNVGTVQAQFVQIYDWITQNPFEVVTLLIGNSDLVDVSKYVPAIENSGLSRLAYIPPKFPMALGDWPTLGELILRQKRVVIFMDYNANQTQVPYILDEFTQMWETPFSPTDPAFPCTVQRPPNRPRQESADRLFMANHNLNTEISLLGASILVPNVAQINQTNAVNGSGSLGAAAQQCLNDWNRSPNFLLVDFYNYPTSNPGAVFKVAAKYNNVTYNGKCCGANARSAASNREVGAMQYSVAIIFFIVTFML